MAAYLATLARGKGPLSSRQLKQVQKWIDEDWESHDVDRDAVRLIQRLLHTIKEPNGAESRATNDAKTGKTNRRR